MCGAERHHYTWPVVRKTVYNIPGISFIHRGNNLILFMPMTTILASETVNHLDHNTATDRTTM